MTNRKVMSMSRLLVLAALLSFAAGANGGEWHVDKTGGENQVRFTSQVAGFSFDGVTSRVDGYVYWEGQELFERNDQLLFEVDLSSLETGIGKRDRDMRGVLETSRWPKAVFKGEIAHHERVDSTLAAYRIEVAGRLFLHGVERELEVPGTIILEKGRTKAEASFSLKLADFGIEAPSLAAFIKVSEKVVITMSFSLKHVQQKED